MHRAILVNISRVMVLVLLFTWSSIPPDLVFAAKANMPAKENLEQAAQKLERLFDALEETAKEIPRDTFDPKAIVDKVGREPPKLFAWVRDNTYLVPYRGTLRGPIGVLMDRLGNSLDRALLLHELLTIAGHKAQLARGTLSKEQAEIVLNEARPIPPGGALPPEEESGESMDELISKYGDKYGLDPVELQRVAQKLTLQQQHMAEEVAQRVEDQTRAILELVGEPEVDIRAAERAKAIEALQDHWWVQWKGASGWVDLDSTLPRAKAGENLVEVEATHQADDIDEELQHLVTIRVVIERWEDGELEEEQVLEHTLHPSKLFGKRIALRHVPLNWPEDLDLFTDEKPLERLKTIVLQEKEWLPVLSVDTEQIVQSSFTVSGEVKDEPGKKPASPAEGLGRGVGGLSGGITGALSGEEPERVEKQESRLTAEWIEYEWRTPGKRLTLSRRQVFDLLGSAVRTEQHIPTLEINDKHRMARGLSLLGETGILVQNCRLSPEYLDHLLVIGLLANFDLIKNILQYKSESISFNESPRITLPGPLHALSANRFLLAPDADAVYIDTSNVFSYHVQFVAKDLGRISAIVGLDIVRNDVAVPNEVADPFTVRVTQGVVDTIVEASLLGRYDNVENISEIYERSVGQRIGWTAARDIEEFATQRDQLSDDIRARIEHDLYQGFEIMVPTKPVRLGDRFVVGWWRINPMTGDTIGRGERGWGQALGQYIIRWFTVSGLCLIIWALKHPVAPVGEAVKAVGICAALGFLVMITFGTMITHFVAQAPSGLILVGARVVYKKIDWLINIMAMLIGGVL